MNKFPRVNVSILVIKNNQILLGLLSHQWLHNGKQVYGTPGRDINFQESMGDAIKRNIREEIHCDVIHYEIICVNANYEWGNHYIGIGATSTIKGDPERVHPEDWDTWEWFDIDNLPLNLLPEAKHLIECFLKKKVTVSE